MIILIGIIMILRFFIQSLTNGRVDAFDLFIIGFYVLLRFGKVPEKYAIVRKTALVGLYCYIAALIANLASFRLFVLPNPMQDSIWTKILLDWEWVYLLFNKLIMLLYPYEMSGLSTGFITHSRGFLYNPIKVF